MILKAQQDFSIKMFDKLRLGSTHAVHDNCVKYTLICIKGIGSLACQ